MKLSESSRNGWRICMSSTSARKPRGLQRKKGRVMAAAIANALARSRTVARGVRSPSGRRKAASGASTIAYCLMPKSPPSAQGKSRGARAAQKSVSERKSTTVGSVHEPSSMKNSRGESSSI